MSDELRKQIADLLRETGHAHHEAFAETDGDDPDWPIWYAGYLKEKLGELLNAEFTQTELTYLFVSADKEQNQRAPGHKDWPSYYAKFLIERYR